MTTDHEPMTLKEIAEIEGVSHQMVAIVLNRALKKLEKELEKRGLKLEDFL